MKWWLNKILFHWYYSSVPEHFKKWGFIKSVNLLIQNYKHSQFQLKSKNEVIKKAIDTEDKLRKELTDLKIQLVGNSKLIDGINKSFGTKFTKPEDN